MKFLMTKFETNRNYHNMTKDKTTKADHGHIHVVRGTRLKNVLKVEYFCHLYLAEVIYSYHTLPFSLTPSSDIVFSSDNT